jgi:hypothetical protein
METLLDVTEIAEILKHMGCPADKTARMALQLDKRADQLAAQKGCSKIEAITHLLKLMREGWAAKEKEI